MRLSPQSSVVSTTFLVLFIFISSFGWTTFANPEDLPWGDINVMVLTDVHSWIGGHLHESDRNADYGDVLSFYERLKKHAKQQGRDLWFVMNGDWIHGTGLAMAGNATVLAPLLQRMPWDALTIGNHELYHKAVVDTMTQPGGMLATFGDKYLTSNVLHADTLEPLGHRYRILTGHRHTTLVFGFLYNLRDPSTSIHIEMVESAVNDEWFGTALRDEKYDAIMVLSHMDVNDPLVKVINNAIRKIVPDRTPIQFITGHSHIRAQSKVDAWSRSFEAGAFLDTVGFVSFPARDTALASSGKKDAAQLFQYRFLDANTETLRTILDVDELATNNGKELSRLIEQAQEALGLRQIVGCPPRNYYVNRSLHRDDSLWKLYQDEVVPSQLFKGDEDKAMFITSDSWRYDVRYGSVDGRASNQMTIDDVVAVAPYNEPIYYIGDINGWTLRKMNSSLNTYSVKKTLPDWVLVGDVKDADQYKLYSHEANVPWIKQELERLFVKTFKMQKTGDTDTLMWLKFIQKAWPCPRLNGDKEVYRKAVPWWVDPVNLAIEAGDGEEDEENVDELELEDPTPIDGDDSPSSASSSSTSGKSPTTTVKKTTSAGGVSNQHVQNHEKHKKTRQRIKKIVALSIAAIIMIFPFVGMYYAIFGEHNPVADMGATFYDPSEMRALKRGDKSGGHRRGRRGRRGYNDIPSSEIEFV